MIPYVLKLMDKSSNPHEGFLLYAQQKIIYILFT